MSVRQDLAVDFKRVFCQAQLTPWIWLYSAVRFTIEGPIVFAACPFYRWQSLMFLVAIRFRKEQQILFPLLAPLLYTRYQVKLQFKLVYCPILRLWQFRFVLRDEFLAVQQTLDLSLELPARQSHLPQVEGWWNSKTQLLLDRVLLENSRTKQFCFALSEAELMVFSFSAQVDLFLNSNRPLCWRKTKLV